LAPGMDSIGRAVKDAFIAGAFDAPLPPSGVTRALSAALGITRALPAALGVPNTLLSGARKALLPSSGGSAVIFVLPSRTIAEGPSADAPTSNCSVATLAVSLFVGANAVIVDVPIAHSLRSPFL